MASQVTAPRLLDVLAADMPEELERLRAVFLGFAAFGAARGAAPPAELDGVSCCNVQITHPSIPAFATLCDAIF